MFFPNSVGLLYSAFTQFLGFKVNSGEYKMMGLAPYGQPKYTDLILKEIINLNEDGSIQLNQKYFDYISGSSMTSNKLSDLFNRPKQGFALPIDAWLRTSLKDWAENLLDKKKLEDNQYFDSGLIEKIWQEHLTEKRNWQYPIWNILMLQSWLENKN